METHYFAIEIWLIDWLINKISIIRSSFPSGLCSNVLTPPKTREVLHNLSHVTDAEVRRLVLSALWKSSDLHPLPTGLVKDCIDVLVTPMVSIVTETGHTYRPLSVFSLRFASLSRQLIPTQHCFLHIIIFRSLVSCQPGIYASRARADNLGASLARDAIWGHQHLKGPQVHFNILSFFKFGQLRVILAGYDTISHMPSHSNSKHWRSSCMPSRSYFASTSANFNSCSRSRWSRVSSCRRSKLADSLSTRLSIVRLSTICILSITWSTNGYLPEYLSEWPNIRHVM